MPAPPPTRRNRGIAAQLTIQSASGSTRTSARLSSHPTRNPAAMPAIASTEPMAKPAIGLVTSRHKPLRPDEVVVGIGAPVAVELPQLPHLGDLLEVQVTDDQLLVMR